MIVNGKEIARIMEESLREKLSKLPQKRVCFVLFGKDPGSLQFIKLKSKVAERLGILVETLEYPDDIKTDEAIKIVGSIGKKTDGIVVQLPLPKNIDTEKVLNTVPKEKDIDLLGSVKKEEYEKGLSRNMPPVARAVMEIFKYHNVDLANKKILIVGDGKLVGKPVSVMLSKMKIEHQIINRKTEETTKKEKMKESDIIISGVGIPHMIKPDMIKEGSVVIDAGTSEQNGKVLGDVDPECASKTSLISLVPGGLGPITVVSLFSNLLDITESF